MQVVLPLAAATKIRLHHQALRHQAQAQPQQVNWAVYPSQGVVTRTPLLAAAVVLQLQAVGLLLLTALPLLLPVAMSSEMAGVRSDSV